MTGAGEGDTQGTTRYAPILAVAFILWPVMGLLGAQGYSLLLGMVALPVLVLFRPRPTLGLKALPVLLGLLFITWVAITESWSPASKGILSGNILHGDFAVRATSVRIILVFLFACLAIAATLNIRQGSAQTSSRVMLGAFAVQGLMVFLSAFLGLPVVKLIYGGDPARIAEGVQNISRNANAFALCVPILAAYLATRSGFRWKALAAVLVVASFLAFLLVDSQSAQFGMITMLLGFGVCALFPAISLRFVIWAIGAYIAAAPIIMGLLIRATGPIAEQLPGSFRSRLWSWEVVIGKTAEAPLAGHGLSASKTWGETYADHPAWLAQLPDFWANYPVVPGHPHNMPLQLWSETGMVGAVLAGFALMTLAIVLPSGERLRSDVRYAAVGLASVTLSLMSFAYSAWNEAFWSGVVLAVCAIILLSRRERGSM